MSTGKVAEILKFTDDKDLTSGEFEKLIVELEMLKDIAYDIEVKNHEIQEDEKELSRKIITGEIL